MNTEPKVSVIIPVYNTEKYLRQCLDSVVNQTLKDIEIICVDDGSTDRSLEILREYESQDSRVRVLTQENINAGAARNHGLRHATGKYLSFLDADDFFEPDMLEKAYDRAEETRAEIVAFGSDQYIQDSRKYRPMRWAIRKDLLPGTAVFSGYDIPKDRFKAFVGWAWDKLFLREFIVENQLTFQEQRTTNDMYFVFSAIIRAQRISVLERVFVHQRKQTENTLSVTRERSWHCFYDALNKVKRQMQEWDVWEWVEQDFVNYAVHAIMWNLSTLAEKTQRLLYEKLADEWIAALDIPTKPESYFYSQGEYQSVLRILALPYEEYFTKKGVREIKQRESSSAPKVSVIMPSLNVGEYIRECIDSVVNQTLEDIEIICVDAGSTDGTLAVLEEYAAKDKRVTIIHSDKKSYGYQMNLGLKAAKGEYLAIAETDDYLKSDMYAVLCPIADKHELDILKADFCIFVGDGDQREFTYRSMVQDNSYCNRVIDPAQELQVFKANNVTWSGLYRVSFLRENNILWNETPGASYQDNGFWFQTFCQARRIMFYNKPFYMLRRDNPNSSVKSRAKVYCICDEYDYIRSILKKDPALEHKFAPICALYRHNNYNWTLNRVADEFKLEFIQRFAQDFKQIQAAGELDERLFAKDQWTRLMWIMKDPDGFYESRFAPKKPVAVSKQMSQEELRKALQVANRRIAVLNQEIKDIKNSWTYRIGRFITWLPRKVRGGLRCYQEHGFHYTLEWVMVHLRLKKDPHKVSAPVPKPQPASTSNPAPVPKPQPIKRDYEYYSKLPPERYEEELKLWYEQVMKEPLDLEAPKTFNEKIQWLKLYDSTPIKTRLADKYLVREWVKEKIGEEYLIPLLGVWDSFDEIDFDALPNQFVLKSNHNSGGNILVQDKAHFDIEGAKKKFKYWLSRNYAFSYGLELHYMNIPPKIIAEQYMADLDGDIFDYRFFCFNGTPQYVWVDVGSGTTHHKRNIYDMDWNMQDYRVNYPFIEPAPDKPETFDEMAKCAEILCKDFAFVRVDFYSVGGRVYFGEMTFTPQSGTGKWASEKQNRLYGDLIQLPQKSPLPERTL